MVNYTSPATTAISDTRPAESDGKVWVDTSQDPPKMKLYDAATQAFIPASAKSTIVSQTSPTPEVGKIWFEPAQDGTNMYAASSERWEFLKFLPEIPDSALTQHLVAWYRFEDGDARDYTARLNATFADSTAYDGTVNGATHNNSGAVTDFKTGANSGNFEFDGSDDTIKVTHDPGLNQNVFTIMAWTDPASLRRNEIYNKESGDAYATLTHADQYGRPYYFLVRDQNGNRDDVFTSGPASGVHHFAARRDNSFPGSGALDIFIDGVKQSTSVDASQGANDITNTGNVYIGSRDGVQNSYNGTLDDVRLYNTDLTDSQINDIYNATKP